MPSEKREKVLQNISERFIPLRKCLLTKTGEKKNQAEKKKKNHTKKPQSPRKKWRRIFEDHKWYKTFLPHLQIISEQG